MFYAFVKKDLATDSPGLFVADVFIRNVLIASVCYFNIYYLFSKYCRRGRYLLYGLMVLVLLLLYAFVQHLADGWLAAQLSSSDYSHLFNHGPYYHFSIGLFYLSFTLALELSKRWFTQQLALHKVEAEKLQAELNYLKAQLNPHFLFNSLNTIYFQIDKSNQDARQSLQKFSEMLRYQLYECNEETIPIEKEIGYLENYVGLQALRKNAHHRISFDTSRSVSDFRIAPLLLLPFVENAFKHLSQYSDRDNVIALQLDKRDDTFWFGVKNTFDQGTGGPDGGIGLKNVTRRLDLLYPGKYRLDIQKDTGEFSVGLQIQLT